MCAFAANAGRVDHFYVSPGSLRVILCKKSTPRQKRDNQQNFILIILGTLQVFKRKISLTSLVRTRAGKFPGFILALIRHWKSIVLFPPATGIDPVEFLQFVDFGEGLQRGIEPAQFLDWQDRVFRLRIMGRRE